MEEIQNEEELTEITIPDLLVYIWMDDIPSVVDVNYIVVLHSQLVNSEYYSEFQYQWVGSNDGINYIPIPSATSSEYIVTIIEFQNYDWYKLIVHYR